jgi:hypothetical protein
MAYLWGKEYSKDDLKQRIGDMSQIAGAKSYELKDGKAYGARAVDVTTGSGFQFTVLPDRGMDIAWASYKGKPLSHITNTGIVSSKYYEPRGEGLFRSFFAGLLTTCGLSNVGFPCEAGGIEYGQHGRISNTPAEKVNTDEYWDQDDYRITVSGKVRESRFFGENLVLTRTIQTALGEKRFVLRDVVENQGYSAAPLMILYHFNVGFPLLNAKSRLIINVAGTQYFDGHSEKGENEYMVFQDPTPGYHRYVFFHNLNGDKDGNALCALVDGGFGKNPLGLYLRFNLRQLPEFLEFKMMGQSEYVVSLEPANCRTYGRAREEAAKRVKYIEPGEKKEFRIEIGVMEGPEEIEKITDEIKALG